MKFFCLVWLAYVAALQFVVNARILIVDPIRLTIDTFSNTEATVIDRVLKGYIEVADPPGACSKIAPPTVPANSTMKKFVLVNGTRECDIITKLHNVAAVGYDVAVIYDPFPELFEYNITFPIPKSEVNVSVVIVLCEDGILIRNNYLFHNLRDEDKFIIEIIPTASFTDLFLAGVMLIIVLLVLAVPAALITLILHKAYQKLRGYWNRNNNEHAHLDAESEEVAHVNGGEVAHVNGGEVAHVNGGEVPHVHIRMSREECLQACRSGHVKRVLRTLNEKYPEVHYTLGDKYDTCYICMESFEEGESVRILSCKHAFHPCCIDPWLLKYGVKKRCPNCRDNTLLHSSYNESVATESTHLLGSSCPSYGVSINYDP